MISGELGNAVCTAKGGAQRPCAPRNLYKARIVHEASNALRCYELSGNALVASQNISSLVYDVEKPTFLSNTSYTTRNASRMLQTLTYDVISTCALMCNYTLSLHAQSLSVEMLQFPNNAQYTQQMYAT